MRRLGTLFLAPVALAVTMAAPATAAPTLIGDTITFQLLDDGLIDIETILAPGDGIDEGDSSNIGAVMLDGEYIHVFAQSVEFRLFGGADPVPGFPGYLTTGFPADARYVLSGLFEPSVSEITNVSIDALLTTAVNVALGFQVFFDAHSVTLYVDDLGILESPENLGIVRLNFTVQELQEPPTPVPEPATLALVGSGLAAAWLRRRPASGRDAVSRN